MNFKKWLEDQEQIDNGLFLLESIYLENNNSLFIEKIIEGIKKIDKIVGISKFIKMVPKTIKASMLFVFSVLKFSTVVHNPSEWKKHSKEIIDNFAEASKLGLASGLIIPIAIAVVPGSAEVTGILAKIVSYGYFYMGNWIENMIDHPKYGEIAKELLPYFTFKK